MATVRIFDLHERGYLAFDLRDLIRLLAPRSLSATWIVVSPYESEFEATGEGGVKLGKLAEKRAAIAGTDLAAIAGKTDQVIWGEFVGSLPSNPNWVVIRAFDSTYYEVTTSDDWILSKLQTTFKDVRPLDVNL
jgi:hypothetical protein